MAEFPINLMSSQMLNVFAQDSFSVATLTAVINQVPYTPGYLGSIPGLFFADGIYTTSAVIEEHSGVLKVIKTSERGSAPEVADQTKRQQRIANCVRIALTDYVTVDMVQNVLSAAQAAGRSPLAAAEELIASKFAGPFGLRARTDLTLEYHRLGAIQGKVLDSDGEVINDWYRHFDITPTPDLSVSLGSIKADEQVFRTALTGASRDMQDALGALALTGFRPIILCGDNVFDKAYGNREVTAALRAKSTGTASLDVFSSNGAYGAFEYAGFLFVNYRGLSSSPVRIDPDEGRIFPAGVPGLFQQLFGPADTMAMANTKGLPIYGMMLPENQTSRRLAIESQSNPLTICAAPKALRRFVFAA